MRKTFAHRFQRCPSCQAKLVCQDNNCNCSQCDFIIYDNPAPCVTVAIVKDDKVLMAKRGIEPHKGGWDLPGGFIETEETGEQAALREVKEETDLTIKLEQYLGAVPDEYNGEPTIPLLFRARIMSGEPKAQDDVAELRWFKLDRLPDKIAFKTVQVLLDKLKNQTT